MAESQRDDLASGSSSEEEQGAPPSAAASVPAPGAAGAAGSASRKPRAPRAPAARAPPAGSAHVTIALGPEHVAEYMAYKSAERLDALMAMRPPRRAPAGGRIASARPEFFPPAPAYGQDAPVAATGPYGHYRPNVQSRQAQAPPRAPRAPRPAYAGAGVGAPQAAPRPRPAAPRRVAPVPVAAPAAAAQHAYAADDDDDAELDALIASLSSNAKRAVAQKKPAGAAFQRRTGPARSNEEVEYDDDGYGY